MHAWVPRRSSETERQLLSVGGAGWGSLVRDQDQFPPDGRILGRVEESEHAEVSTNPLWPWNIVGSPRKRKGGRTLGINYIQWTRESKVWTKRWWARGAWPIFFLFFFFFAYLRVYNFPSERRVNQNNLVLLLPLAWSARLIHIGSASSHSSTTTPAVWRWQDASSGRMPSSNLLWRAVLWWQRGHVAAAPPSAAPSALCEVPPVPLPRLEDDRDAARRPCLCAPDKSARGSSAHLNYPKKAVNTIGWCGYNGSFSTCCPWGFCWKEKKKRKKKK